MSNFCAELSKRWFSPSPERQPRSVICSIADVLTAKLSDTSIEESDKIIIAMNCMQVVGQPLMRLTEDQLKKDDKPCRCSAVLLQLLLSACVTTICHSARRQRPDANLAVLVGGDGCMIAVPRSITPFAAQGATNSSRRLNINARWRRRADSSRQPCSRIP